MSPERKKIDELAERAGGYFSLPSARKFSSRGALSMLW